MILLLLFLLLTPVSAFAFPDTSVLDTFTGTDNTSPPNSNWTNGEIRSSGAGGCDLEDNAVAPGTTGGFHGCIWNPQTFGPDSEAYATIVNVGSTAFFAVCVRLVNIGNGTTDGYCVETTDGTDDFTIYRVDNEVGTSLNVTAPGGAVDVGDKFGIKAVGDQICSWWNNDGGGWVQVACATDATYSAGGRIGLYLNGNETVGGLDDFGGGNVIATSRRAIAPVEVN